MSLLMELVIALAIFAAGFGGGVRWHIGEDAIDAQKAATARETDQRQQRRFNDDLAGRHADQLETLNTQLRSAHAQIARLSGRPCLDPGTVGVLNATGVLDERRGAAPNAAQAPAAAASAASDGAEATDVDVADYIAVCRTRYAEVADQLNQILDREDKRHPLDPPTTERKP
jgi:hypothetical protein